MVIRLLYNINISLNILIKIIFIMTDFALLALCTFSIADKNPIYFISIRSAKYRRTYIVHSWPYLWWVNSPMLSKGFYYILLNQPQSMYLSCIVKKNIILKPILLTRRNCSFYPITNDVQYLGIDQTKLSVYENDSVTVLNAFISMIPQDATKTLAQQHKSLNS